MASQESFSIGELSRHLGMTPQGLHWYEEQGLVSPKRINSYRNYSIEDFCLLSRIRFYHQMGLSIEEIDGLLAEPLESIASKLQGYVDLRRRELDKEQQKLRILEERSQLTRGFSAKEDSYAVSTLEAFYFRDSVVAKECGSEQRAIIRKWVEEIPLVQYLAIIDFSDGSAKTKRVGFMLPKSSLDYVSDAVREELGLGSCMLFEEHAVLYGVCKATGHVAGQALESLTAYHDAGMLEGFMFVRPITCQRIDNETHTYWEIWAPIAQSLRSDCAVTAQ